MKTEQEIKTLIRSLKERKNQGTMFDTNYDKLDGCLEALEWVIASE